MSDDQPAPAPPPTGDTSPSPKAQSRLRLVGNVIVFQFKLMADGLRDLLLSPLSFVAALLGLIAGGNEPEQYFRRLLRFGQRTERWINLFGDQHRSGTADDFIEPLKDKGLEKVEAHPLTRKISSELNQRLDQINASVSARSQNRSE